MRTTWRCDAASRASRCYSAPGSSRYPRCGRTTWVSGEFSGDWRAASSPNQSEWEWSTYEGGQGVCPARASLLGGLVNVYSRALAIPEDRVVDFAAIPYLGPTDPKNRNVGILNEQLVWLDYDRNWNDGPPCQHVSC